MKKSDREIVFNKYNGKCAYCGCDLVKGWHVDHLVPVRRIWKNISGGYVHINTPSQKWESAKKIIIGCENPEMECIENYMPACASCNINKHSESLEDFRKAITGYMKHLNEINTQYKIAKRYGLVKEYIKPIVFYFETFNK